MPESFLIVDDDPDVLKAAVAVLETVAKDVRTALSPDGMASQARLFDAVLLDMNFVAGARSGEAGLDALAQFQAADPMLSVVLMTTYGGVGLAVQALKQGAADFVLKPWRNEALATTMRAAADQTAQRRKSGIELNLEALERRAIERALALYDGNVSHAAAALGLTRPALYRRMERYEL